MREHEQCGDPRRRQQFEHQPPGRHQLQLAPVAVAQPGGNGAVARLLRRLALERADVAQAPREILAVPEQPGHVDDILASDQRLLAAVGARRQQPQRHQQRRRQHQRRRDPERETEADGGADRGDQQLLQGAEALHDELDVVGEHVGDFRGRRIRQRGQRRVDQARVHRASQVHAVAADQTRAQPRRLPAQQREGAGRGGKDGSLHLHAATRVEQRAAERQRLSRLHQRHQQQGREAAGESRAQRQHDVRNRFHPLDAGERARQRTQQIPRPILRPRRLSRRHDGSALSTGQRGRGFDVLRGGSGQHLSGPEFPRR